ncbi:MAG: hypothetical protein KAU20_02375 [Nanoarchaeota archaeon]|nr:hypothetical protein [Nanoarchaeota archaeon]
MFIQIYIKDELITRYGSIFLHKPNPELEGTQMILSGFEYKVIEGENTIELRIAHDKDVIGGKSPIQKEQSGDTQEQEDQTKVDISQQEIPPVERPEHDSTDAAENSETVTPESPEDKD